MNTVKTSVVGFVCTMIFCCFVQLMFFCNFGHPNVIVEDGDTLLGWWFMLFVSTWTSFILLGLIMDMVDLVKYYCKR